MKIFKHNLFREFSFYSSSTLMLQGGRIIVELIVAKTLGPTIWGVWYFLNMILVYDPMTNLGVVSGMNREIPINMGAKRVDVTTSIQNVTFTFVLITSLIFSVIIFVISCFFYKSTFYNNILLLIPLFFITQFSKLLDTSLRSGSLFNVLSKKQFFFSILFPCLVLPASFYLGLNGFMVGFIFTMLITTSVIYWKSDVKYSLEYDFGLIRKLIKIGFPIMAVGITYVFLNTADRWVIGLMLGVEELGYYSLAIIVFGGLTLLPKLISQQIYPKMAFDWGRSGLVSDIRKWTNMQTKITFVIVVSIFFFAFFLFPLIINKWLPSYEKGIDSVKIILFGPLFMPFSAGWGNALNIINKQNYYLVAIVIAVIINVSLNYLFVTMGYGIEGVAFGTVLSFGLYCIGIMYVGKYFLKEYEKTN